MSWLVEADQIKYMNNFAYYSKLAIVKRCMGHFWQISHSLFFINQSFIASHIMMQIFLNCCNYLLVFSLHNPWITKDTQKRQNMTSQASFTSCFLRLLYPGNCVKRQKPKPVKTPSMLSNTQVLNIDWETDFKIFLYKSLNIFLNRNHS